MNTVISRRNLLTTATVLPLVAGCAQLSGLVASAPQIAQDANLIAQAVQAVLPTIEALTGLAGGAKNTIAGVVGEIASVTGQISSAGSTNAVSLVQQLGGGVGTLASLLSGVSGLPGIISSVISDALALMPVIEATVGISAVPKASRFATRVSPDAARSDLKLIVAGLR